MSKTTILVLFIIIVTLTVVLTSVSSHVQKMPDTMTGQIVNSQVKYISNYALTYAWQQLVDKNYSLVAGMAVKNFSNFNVLDGMINKISIDINPQKDTIRIAADVSCQMQGITTNHQGKALFAYDPKILDPNGITDAITTTGTVDIKGSSEVKGTIAEHTLLDFESVFGYSKEDVKNGANRTYIDPANNFAAPDGITWVEQVNDNSVKISNSDWVGSGLLYVDGNIEMTGGYFYGIVWVTGDMDMGVGSAWVEGAIVIESTSTVIFKLGGTAKVEYNNNAVSQLLQMVWPEKDKFDILVWYE